jgi:hypothetical protein
MKLPTEAIYHSPHPFWCEKVVPPVRVDRSPFVLGSSLNVLLYSEFLGIRLLYIVIADKTNIKLNHWLFELWGCSSSKQSKQKSSQWETNAKELGIQKNVRRTSENKRGSIYPYTSPSPKSSPDGRRMTQKRISETSAKHQGRDPPDNPHITTDRTSANFHSQTWPISKNPICKKLHQPSMTLRSPPMTLSAFITVNTSQ